MYGLLVVQAFRPDRLVAMARVFVEKTLGTEFVHTAEKELNLSDIVENEVHISVMTFSSFRYTVEEPVALLLK